MPEPEQTKKCPYSKLDALDHVADSDGNAEFWRFLRAENADLWKILRESTPPRPATGYALGVIDPAADYRANRDADQVQSAAETALASLGFSAEERGEIARELSTPDLLAGIEKFGEGIRLAGPEWEIDPAASTDQTFHAIYNPDTRTITRYTNWEEAEAAYRRENFETLDKLVAAAEAAAKSAAALAEALDSAEIRRALSERGRG